MTEYKLSGVCTDDIAFPVIPRIDNYTETISIALVQKGYMKRMINNWGITEDNQSCHQAELKLLCDVSKFARDMCSLTHFLVLLDQDTELKKLNEDEMGYLLKRGADLHSIIDSGKKISPKDPVDENATRPGLPGYPITGCSRDDFIKQDKKHPLRNVDYSNRLMGLMQDHDKKRQKDVIKRLRQYRENVFEAANSILNELWQKLRSVLNDCQFT